MGSNVYKLQNDTIILLNIIILETVEEGKQ